MNLKWRAAWMKSCETSAGTHASDWDFVILLMLRHLSQHSSPPKPNAIEALFKKKINEKEFTLLGVTRVLQTFPCLSQRYGWFARLILRSSDF